MAPVLRTALHAIYGVVAAPTGAGAEQGDTAALPARALHTQTRAATVGARTLAATLTTLERTIKAQAPGRAPLLTVRAGAHRSAGRASRTDNALQRWDIFHRAQSTRHSARYRRLVVRQRARWRNYCLLRGSDLRALNVVATFAATRALALMPRICPVTGRCPAGFDFPRAVQLRRCTGRTRLPF